MTDFYSVLKSSIVSRDLRSPADRQEVYDQARKAMIRKLWSFDPPLAEDEIDTRIGLFDAAVDRIESDLELAFAEADALEAQPPRRREPRRLPPPEPQRQPMVYEGYDEEADYMPAFGGRSGARETRDSRQQPPAYRVVDDEPPPAPAPRRYEARPEPARQDRRQQQPPPPPPSPRAKPQQFNPRTAERLDVPPPRPADQWDEPEEDDDVAPPRRVTQDYEPEPYQEEHYEEAAYEEPPPPRGAPARGTGAYQAPKYRQDEDEWQEPAPAPVERAPRQRRAERWESAEVVEAQAFDGEEEYAEVEHAQPKKKSRKKAAKPGRSGGRSPVRILSLTIAALAILLIAFNAYVFLPLIMGPERAPVAPTVAPPKIDDRLPVDGAAAGGAARIVSDSATASEISERSVDVTESLVVFDGRDPTVFEGSPDNPIQFASDADGEFARISSATSAAGARAVIGPGLAERFAGHTVRITLLARASAENGAPNLRFAYQSGVAISHWQAANLTDGYGTYGMIWRVPAGDNNTRDYLLIEPGIPGDGTSTDIRSIKIDILAS